MHRRRRLLSVFVLVQVPLQALNPAPQKLVQVPDMQRCPAVQALPHTPQFTSSLSSFTHDPEQAFWPDGQLTAQSPALQT